MDHLKYMCEVSLRRLYGEHPHRVSVNRLNSELERIEALNLQESFFLASRLMEEIKGEGFPYAAMGDVGASFTAYLLKLTEINPLPPHYRCPCCGYADFDVPAGIECGFDLPAGECPKCETEMAGDGADIACEVFFGPEGIGTVKEIALSVPGEYITDCAIPMFPISRREAFSISAEKDCISFPDERVTLEASRLLSILWKLEIRSGKKSKEISFHSQKLLADVQTHDMCGVPFLGSETVKRLSRKESLRFAFLLRSWGLKRVYSSWKRASLDAVIRDPSQITRAVCFRDDVWNQLTAVGVPGKAAYKLMEIARKGRVAGLEQEWQEMFLHSGVEEDLLRALERTKFLPAKAQGAAYLANALRIAWYCIHAEGSFAEVMKEPREEPYA